MHHGSSILDFEEIAREISAEIQQAYAQPDCDAEHDLGTWIAHTFLYGTPYDVVGIDSGYDYSTHPQQSDRTSFDINAYQTVEDFLGEPNGETIPTFVSGSGLAAETLWSSFENEAYNALARRVRMALAARGIAYAQGASLRGNQEM